jgi:hypothetical protein
MGKKAAAWSQETIKRRIGGTAMTSTLASVLALFAMVCVGGCGTSTKRSESETSTPFSTPLSTGLMAINPQFEYLESLAKDWRRSRLVTTKRASGATSTSKGTMS